MRHYQGRHPDELAGLWLASVEGRAANRADGHPGPCRIGLGALTEESKEAIEPYPEILKEIKLGLQQCARKLAHYLHHEMHLRQEYDRRTYIEKYLPHIGIALQDILALSNDERDSTVIQLDDVLHKSRTSRRSEP